MEYNWGIIKSKIKQYSINAFNENNIHKSGDTIDSDCNIFNNFLDLPTGHFMIDGIGKKLKEPLNNICSGKYKLGDLNTILTSLDSYIKKLLIATKIKTYNEIEKSTLMPLLEIMHISSNTSKFKNELENLRGSFDYILGNAYNSRNEVHNSPNLDDSEILHKFKYCIASYIYLIDYYRSKLLKEYPDLAQTAQSAFNNDSNSQLLYEYINYGKSANEIKNIIIDSFIIKQIYKCGPLPIEEIKTRVKKFSKSTITSSTVTRIVQKLVTKKKLKLDINKYILTEAEESNQKSLSDTYYANQSDFTKKLKKILLKYQIDESNKEKILDELYRFFEKNFNIDIQEIEDEVPDRTIFKNYEQLKDFFQNIGINDSTFDEVFKDIIELCKNNDFIIKVSLGKAFSHISNPDLFDNYLRQQRRDVFLDTQILLYALCISSDYPDINNSFFKIAQTLINIPVEKANIKLYVLSPYIEELIYQLRQALLLLPYTRMKILKDKSISNNVFFKYFFELKRTNRLPPNIDTFEDYLSDRFNLQEDDVYNSDFPSICEGALTGIINQELNINIKTINNLKEIDIINAEQVFSHIYSGNSKEKAGKILQNDAIMGCYLFKTQFETEPFFLTWDKSFNTFRKSYKDKYARKSSIIWHLFSPGQFINHIDLLNFKLDSENLTNDLISIAENSIYIKNETKRLIDVFNKFCDISNLSKNQREKYIELTSHLFSDNDFVNAVTETNEHQSKPVERFVNVINEIYEHYKKSSNHYRELLSDESFYKELLKLLKTYIYSEEDTISNIFSYIDKSGEDV